MSAFYLSLLYHSLANQKKHALFPRGARSIITHFQRTPHSVPQRDASRWKTRMKIEKPYFTLSLVLFQKEILGAGGIFASQFQLVRNARVNTMFCY